MRLPIEDCLPQLRSALACHGRAVLQAPPGAGKTTRVPLALLEEGRIAGRIVMLEPRRLAARAAADRMARSLGETVGETVGYRIRGDRQVSDATRIEVVTEGILTRMLQDRPDLPGIGLVIFDEFHERSLNADLGLALSWEVRQALRPDLEILVMSATLDADPVAALLDDAPLVTSRGRAFPVETRHRDRPLPPRVRIEAEVAEQVRTAMAAGPGGCLVFLPGEAEIHRVAAALEPDLPANVALHKLYGALSVADQRAAIRPAPGRRKLVLATAIAETSLTIEDVRIVVDAGRARRARFNAGSGMSRLVTEPVSRAEADQRRGARRTGGAGRLLPDVDQGRRGCAAGISTGRDRGHRPDRAGAGPCAVGVRRWFGVPDTTARGADGKGPAAAGGTRGAGCTRADHRSRARSGTNAAAPAARASGGPGRPRCGAAGGVAGRARPAARRGQ